MLIDEEYPISGASDHGVSGAIYLNDPDGNDMELYRDRHREEWEYADDGSVKMVIQPLEVQDLLKELESEAQLKRGPKF